MWLTAAVAAVAAAAVQTALLSHYQVSLLASVWLGVATIQININLNQYPILKVKRMAVISS